jgi:PAS domain S-box-containing protein
MTRKKLLVLDDEAKILTSIEDLFEDDNDVLTTSDPATALNLLQEQDVAVILTDERMPGLSGHEFLRKARNLSQATRVMISGYADVNALTEAVNAGQIFAYIAKPWEPLAFRETVRAAIVHFELIQAVERERQLLHALMECIPDPIYFKDPESRYTRLNREQMRVLGATNPGDCEGRTDADFLGPEHSRQAYLDEQEIIRSGRAVADRVERIRMADGRYRWMSTTKVPIPGADGAVTGLACVSRDITNLKDTEETLRRESALLQLLQAITVGANESSDIEQAARSCLDRICSHTGCPVGHVWLLAPDPGGGLISTGLWRLEQNGGFAAFRDTFADGSSAAAGELPARILASERPEWVIDGNQNDGHRRAAGFRSGFGFPILAGKRAIGVLEFFSLSEAVPDDDLLMLMVLIGSQLGEVAVRQGAKEELLRATHAAESANRAKSEFLSSMSHEIRTPMNAILGMADLLSATTLTAEQQNLVAIFQRGGAKLLSLINDILDLSKVESGRFDLNVVDFDLSAVLERTLELMRPRAEAKGLRLTMEIPLDVPVLLQGDPDRLRQVLINLIGNAVKFTERGTVTLRIEAAPEVAEPCVLKFNITDTGPGIPAEKLAMIFDRFTQIDSSTTRKQEGTGLGLAISKALVELMGGEIGVLNERGKGSTFFFTARFGLATSRPLPESVESRTLPAVPTSVAIPPVEAGVQAAAPSTQVLVVEDSDDNLFLVQAFLKNSAIHLDVARNGWEGVEKVLSKAYDLVLMDVQMPVMDGHTATRVIRLQEEERHSLGVPILALTAHASQDAIDQSMRAGCSGHLSKPIDRDSLLAAISNYARRH